MFGMADLAGKSLQLIIGNPVQQRNFVTADYPRMFGMADLAGTSLQLIIWNFVQLRNFVAADYLERRAADYLDSRLFGTADFLS